MPTIFDGLNQVCDQWLGIDATWPGTTEPRYQHRSVFERLCREGWRGHDAELLLRSLYDQILQSWSGSPSRSVENWRFVKQTYLGPANLRPEVSLERTISQITDENWVNQVPTAMGIDDSGAHHIDLIHRRGSEFTFIELKVDANNPVYAAFELVQYAMTYILSRSHPDRLGYDLADLEILRAKQVKLVVLAPDEFYPPGCHQWLRRLEVALNAGLGAFAHEIPHVPSSFRFEAFPDGFVWNPEARNEESIKRDLLWAIHTRRPLFP